MTDDQTKFRPNKPPRCNWRDIPAKSIAWRDNEISSIAGGKVHRMCSEGSVWQDSVFSQHAWQDKTLGEIAAMGPRHWRRCTDIGDMAVDVIKWMIDEAAEGRPRMLAMSGEPASDAYVPKCERTHNGEPT